MFTWFSAGDFSVALELAAEDGIDEVPYRYMRARVRVEAGEEPRKGDGTDQVAADASHQRR